MKKIIKTIVLLSMIDVVGSIFAMQQRAKPACFASLWEAYENRGSGFPLFLAGVLRAIEQNKHVLPETVDTWVENSLYYLKERGGVSGQIVSEAECLELFEAIGHKEKFSAACNKSL